MSVTTTADESIWQAKKDIQSAIENIAAVVIKKEWGWEDYNGDYKEKLREALIALMKIQNDIGE